MSKVEKETTAYTTEECIAMGKKRGDGEATMVVRFDGDSYEETLTMTFKKCLALIDDLRKEAEEKGFYSLILAIAADEGLVTYSWLTEQSRHREEILRKEEQELKLEANITNSLRLFSISDINGGMDKIIEVMTLSNVESRWEHAFNDETSVTIDEEGVPRLSVSYRGSRLRRHKLIWSEAYGVWRLEGEAPERRSAKSLVELRVDVLANRLKTSEAPYLDKDGHWAIECGDEGWMAFKDGQYVVGAYGTSTPDPILNKICSEVTNFDGLSYDSKTGRAATKSIHEKDDEQMSLVLKLVLGMQNRD